MWLEVRVDSNNDLFASTKGDNGKSLVRGGQKVT